MNFFVIFQRCLTSCLTYKMEVSRQRHLTVQFKYTCKNCNSQAHFLNLILVYIMMEYLAKGSLLNVLHVSKDEIGIKDLIKFARDIACGMEYLVNEKVNMSKLFSSFRGHFPTFFLLLYLNFFQLEIFTP